MDRPLGPRGPRHAAFSPEALPRSRGRSIALRAALLSKVCRAVKGGFLWCSQGTGDLPPHLQSSCTVHPAGHLRKVGWAASQAPSPVIWSEGLCGICPASPCPDSTSQGRAMCSASAGQLGHHWPPGISPTNSVCVHAGPRACVVTPHYLAPHTTSTGGCGAWAGRGRQHEGVWRYLVLPPVWERPLCLSGPMSRGLPMVPSCSCGALNGQEGEVEGDGNGLT